jgi:hypothetical protein
MVERGVGGRAELTCCRQKMQWSRLADRVSNSDASCPLRDTISIWIDVALGVRSEIHISRQVHKV